MAHYTHTETRKISTPREWLRVGSQIGHLVNEWSGRTDLVVMVGPEASQPAPALFNPNMAEIEVNTDNAFGAMIDPEDVGDITKRHTQFEFPKATGAIFHESCHARFSRWSLEQAYKDLTKEEYEALNLLEESRIEGFGAKMRPENKIFLRSSALEIVLADVEESIKTLTNTHAAAHLAGLVLARIDAGILEYEDVSEIAPIIETLLGEDLLAQLRPLWIEAQAHGDHGNAVPMYDLARAWVKAVNQTAEDRGEEAPSSESNDGIPQGLSDAIKALKDAIDQTAINTFDDIADQQMSEEWKEVANAKAQASKQEREHRAEASEIFGRGTGPVAETGTYSRLRERRAPNAEERVAAVTVAKLLDKAKYRERSETEVKSILPPGRLRTRALVQGQALKSKGVTQQTEAWRRTARKHTEDPTLTIGVMVDISGSMGEAMEPMASTAWIMSEATRRVQGKAAMVYYGQGVFPTLKAGQHLSEVNVYTAPDGTEKFDKAFKALDGSLNLLHGTGARLLVIVSDGHYTTEETNKTKAWMSECQRNGVAVMWITYDSISHVERLTAKSDVHVVNGRGSIRDVAGLIGKACADALTKTTARQAA